MIVAAAENILGTFAHVVLGAAVITLLEFALAGEQQNFASRVRGFLFSFASLAAAVLITNLAQGLMRQAELSPLFQLDLTGTVRSTNLAVQIAGYTLAPVLSVFIYDVGYYWFHRLQHTVPFLWRFHAVHHSIEELNAFNSYHHVSEYLFRIPLLTLPVNLLIWVGEPQVVVTAMVIAAVGKLGHANTRLSFGPFRYLFTEPRYHRIHHSVEQRHWDRNFAFYFPILDILFGTAHFPAKDEYPATGISYAREPRSLCQFLFPPKPASEEQGKHSAPDGTEGRPISA